MSVGAVVAAVLVAGAVAALAPPGDRPREARTRATAVLAARAGGGGAAPPPTPGAPPRDEPRPAEVADALALLALAYRSGLPTTDVLDAVAERASASVRQDLRQVATALRWGAGAREAWESVGPRWSGAARAVVLAGAAGTAPGPLLAAAAEDLRREEEQALEARAARLPVRLVVPTGLVLLPAFCLLTVVPLVAALARRVLGDA